MPVDGAAVDGAGASPGSRSEPSSAWSFARALESRDFTVPTGRSSTLATAAIGSWSTRQRSTMRRSLAPRRCSAAVICCDIRSLSRRSPTSLLGSTACSAAGSFASRRR